MWQPQARPEARLAVVPGLAAVVGRAPCKVSCKASGAVQGLVLRVGGEDTGQGGRATVRAAAEAAVIAFVCSNLFSNF